MFKAGGGARGKRKQKGHFSKRNLYSKEKKKGLEHDEIHQKQEKYKNLEPSSISTFSDLPLSGRTLSGLEKCGYSSPTDIQRESIPLSLRGCDILGAAKTGSGKTLAFLIPVLECLWRSRWTQYDGLGALIVSPTRELAYQTFDVLRKIGSGHDFSAGLVIGGKHLKEESERINTTNIVICTPGRLLQHMDQTYNFNADSLQVLVLDEADRILDLGFRETMNAIIENLPAHRQTLLFSATQTKSVKDLARLSLRDPMFVSVHETAAYSTPQRLQQSYLVCELEEKMNVLWSFVKHHLKHKILVFLSSCKQTRFVYEAFRRLRPGVTVLALHGAMNQLKRVAVYDQFCRKQHALLFATDIAARGLDFPAVNWVIQMDCPEDAHTYIHRAGRTARYEKDGEALLFLLPSEEQAMVAELEDKKIPINNIKVNPKKHWSIDGKLQSLLASDVQLKEFAQRAFVSYLRSVFLMKNKCVFDVSQLNTDKYAASLGLAVPPRVRFLNKLKQKPQNESESDSDDEAKSNAEKILLKGVEKCDERKKKRKDKKKDKSESENSKKLTKTGDNNKASFEKEADDDSAVLRFDVDDGEDLFSVRRDVQIAGPEDDTDIKQSKKQLTRVQAAKRVLKKQVQLNTKLTFDDQGEEQLDPRLHRQTPAAASDSESEEGGLDIDKARRRLQREDQVDKQVFREKVKQKHKEERLKEREKRKLEKEKKMAKRLGTEAVVTLAGSEEEQEMSADGYDSHDDDRGPGDLDHASRDLDLGSGDEDESDSGDESEEESNFRSKRRKLSADEDSSSGDDATESLEADEAMAAQLLGL